MHHSQDGEAVIQSVWQRQRYLSVALHLDCDSRFISAEYQHLLSRNALVCSMSPGWHCNYPGACEGFFGPLKQVRADLFDDIERFHNPKKRCKAAPIDLKASTLFKPSAGAG